MILGHISDLHIYDGGSLQWWHLLGKRALGAGNLLLHRGSVHQETVLRAALRCIEEVGCDHVVVSGDLSNLALESEFRRVRALFASALDPAHTTIIPGNHDRYTVRSSVGRHFEAVFRDFMVSDAHQLVDGSGWPLVRLMDGVALIAVSSAVPMPWFVSGGYVGRRQRLRLRQILSHPRVRRRARVVAMHHPLFPPEHKHIEFPRRLYDRAQVRQELLKGDVHLALHGHNHYYSVRSVELAEGHMVVAEAGSATVSRHDYEVFGAKLNTYRFVDGALREISTFLHRPEAGFAPWRQWKVTSSGVRARHLLAGESA